MPGQQAPNIRELSELQGEGGSDVFTSTRHVNNTNQVSLSLKNYFVEEANLHLPSILRHQAISN